MSEPLLRAVDANALARLLGLGPKEIYDLHRAGVITRGAGRTFALEDTVRRYCEHVRRQCLLTDVAKSKRATQ